MGFVETINARLAAVPRVQSVVGVFVTMVGYLARVNVQGATVEIRCDGWAPPIAGMPVRVETVNGIMRVTGPSQTLPPRGVVVESLEGGTSAVVNAGGTNWTFVVTAPYIPIPAAVVLLNWQGGAIMGELAATPVEPEPPGEIPSSGKSFTDLVIQPTASGKYDTNWNNWWSPPEVWASNNNMGVWVYSGRFNALAGANITRVEIYLPLIKALGAAYVGLHTHQDIPGGAPSITNLTGLPNRNGWVLLPAEWGNHLRDNPSHGIGVTSGGGDNRWRGVGQDGQSGWLRFAGTR